MTVLLVILNQSTGEICYSGAGHPMATILRANGVVEFLAYGNLALGVLALGIYEHHRDRLNPQDKLLLYTDGINEARDGSGQFDFEGIERTLTGHGEWNAEQVAKRSNLRRLPPGPEES